MQTKSLLIEAIENANLFIDGSGRLIVVNTGGQSAGEGGMGSSSKDDKAKGDLSEDGERSGLKDVDESEDNWDPIGKNIKEKEKDNNADD